MRSSFNCRNTTQQVDPASQTGTANGVQAPARKMTRVEVERMLTEYVRDATPGELRAEAKEAMLDCYDRINRSGAAARFSAALQTLHLRTPDNSDLKLDLIRFGLKKLPENLSFLNGIKEISVASNGLKELPQSIGSIHTLETLDISGNKLRTLPESFGGLVKLNKLRAFENRLESLPKSFGSLATLQKLILNSNNLHGPQEWIGSMIGLKKLDLFQNNLQFLPECIGNLTQLESLDVSFNKLDHLPESIGKLSSLTELSALNNKFETLPDSFHQLSRLNKLNIQNNHFEVFPGTISKLPKLTHLNMSCNRIEHLPDSIGSMASLVELNLSLNQIHELPQSIGTMAELEKLNMACNHLQTLPESIRGLQSLLKLNLNANLITELPESIVCLPTDCELRLNMESLSQTVLDQLHHAIVAHHAQHPAQGPRIEFDMAAFNQEFNVKPLSEEINSWRSEGKLPALSNEHPQFQTAIAKLTNLETEAFSKQLGRMRLTAHYTKAPTDLVQRVNTVLNYIQKKPDVLQTCAAIAAEGTETCDDRIALAFIELEEAIINHQSLNEPSLSKLVHTANSLHKSQMLKDIAQEKISNLQGLVDPTEIILKYMVTLSKEFNLPSQLDDMIFHNFALQVSEADIQNAREKIREQSTAENLNTFLATWHPWMQALSKQYPAEYSQVQATAQKQQEKMYEKMDKLTDRLTAAKTRHGELSAQYLDLIAKSNALRVDYRNIETTGLANLTQEIRQVTSESETP